MAPIFQVASLALFFSSAIAMPFKDKSHKHKPDWTPTLPFVPTGTAPVPIPTGTGFSKRWEHSPPFPTGTGLPWPVPTGTGLPFPTGGIPSFPHAEHQSPPKFGVARRHEFKPHWENKPFSPPKPAPSGTMPIPTGTAPVPFPTGTLH